MIGIPSCPNCLLPLTMSLDVERVPWLECTVCHDVFLQPAEILAYVENDYEPRLDY